MGEIVYSSESALRRPAALLAGLWRDLAASRGLAWQIMRRDLTVQYRQSVLGIAWAFVPPIVLTAGLTLATRVRVVNVGATDVPYPVFVLLSTALWQTFVEALYGPVAAVTAARAVLMRINFPPEAILVAKIGQVLFGFVVRLVLIVAMFLWFQTPVASTVWLAPLALLGLVLLGTFLGLLVAPVGLLYQDVSRGLTVLAVAWMFVTPVMYPLPPSGLGHTLLRLNPVTPMLVTTRDLTTTGVVSDPVGVLVVALLTVVGLAATWVVFRLAMPYVIERMGA